MKARGSKGVNHYDATTTEDNMSQVHVTTCGETDIAPPISTYLDYYYVAGFVTFAYCSIINGDSTDESAGIYRSLLKICVRLRQII